MENEPVILEKKTLFTDNSACTLVNKFELNGEDLLHGHDFFEIAITAGGSGRHLSVNGEHRLSEGSVVIIHPGAWHGYIQSSRLLIYNCCFDHHLLARELSWLREDSSLNFLLWVGPYAENRGGVLVARLLDSALPLCLKHLDALGKTQCLSRRAEILGRLLIFLDSLSRGIEDVDMLSQRAGHMHPAVLETIRLLESQIEQSWSLSNLVAQIHLDPSYLVRLFKAEVGLSPIAYLHRCRVEKAAALLSHTALPIAEVAAQVGWLDANLFTRHFRAAYGMSPSEYRKRPAARDAQQS
jgi:AraC family transcriptional regulator, L-rhamnose operon transcriptional activator RhaR